MIVIDKLNISGWDVAIRGMRNPLNSWDKSDSGWGMTDRGLIKYQIGDNDLQLACRLLHGGPEEAKWDRMIHVSMDITAPMFWWSEFDTYKVATTRNSCSKMHKIHVKAFTPDDFTHGAIDAVDYASETFTQVLTTCEQLRQDYNNTHERKYWRALIELLPEGYVMKATWDGSLETVLNIIHQRKTHKLKEEWQPFCDKMLKEIPHCMDFYKAKFIRDRLVLPEKQTKELIEGGGVTLDETKENKGED